MSSEKKSVLVALCVSAVIAIALFITIILIAQAGRAYLAAVIFFFFAIFFLYALDRTNELLATKEDEKKLADYEATHLRKMPDVPITRIIRIVERQRLDAARCE